MDIFEATLKRLPYAKHLRINTDEAFGDPICIQKEKSWIDAVLGRVSWKEIRKPYLERRFASCDYY
jgi:hypothetical protein